MPNFLIWNKYYAMLSSNAQAIVVTLGEALAGDEKLFHFTGRCQHLKLVPTKKSRVGIWVFQGAIMLGCNLPLLIYIKAATVQPTPETVDSIIADWSNIIVEKRATEKTLLAFDTYYFSKATRELETRLEVKYVCACSENKIPMLAKALGHVKKAGEWSGLYSSAKKECIIKYYDPNPALNIKLAYSNCVVKIKRTSKGKKQAVTDVPIYDDVNAHFAGCDKFNKLMINHTWPFRHTGRYSPGWRAQEHNFAFSSILQNCVNVYAHVNELEVSQDSYQNWCCKLAEDLYQYALDLSNA